MKVAMFSAGVNGDNSGDAIIESAIRRALKDVQIERLPLTEPLTEAHIAHVNACDQAIICGTNLYQEVFACNLTEEVVKAIKVPIIPFGIGASAPMGRIPKMNAAGVAAVRAIHRSCTLGSVRDEASLRFLHSIDVHNVELTGCPVLFHGLSCPDFSPSGDGYTLTPRARLLHIDNKWEARQIETLDFLARRYRPKLVLQSPYDIEVSKMLAERYGLEMVMDEAWQAPDYVEAVKAQRVSLGFRLHFAMLSISYGKPAFLISHDSRADEFCKLVDLPPIRIDNYSDNFLALKIDSLDFPADDVRRRWTQLAGKMDGFIRANGLSHNIEVSTAPVARPKPKPRRKIRVAILADVPGWAYDNSMRQIRKELADEFDIDIFYVSEEPTIDPDKYDLLHVCFWGETYHHAFGFPPERVIKEVSSHRWQFDAPYGPQTPESFAKTYLADCRTAICTSTRLMDLTPKQGLNILHTPNGVETSRFKPRGAVRTGQLVFGWAGNANDPLKGFPDLVEPATAGRRFVAAKGATNHKRMPAFYAGLDVFIVASRHEGEPLTLIEAMASGCFPVATDVGVVPELIEHKRNGYILPERSLEALKEALAWCEENPEQIRAAGRANAVWTLRERNWNVCAQFFARAYKDTLNGLKPLFRNDDVSCDSDLTDLKRFSAAFHDNGHIQVHGITLYGNTNTPYRHRGVAVEYQGYATVSELSNETIRKLSQGKTIADRPDLVKWLNQTPDELALHGLYHTDYSAMTAEQQEHDIAEGLALMARLFPTRPVQYFIPPFNRTNRHTFAVAARHGLKVLGTDGPHLEAELEALDLQPGQWHRYHHHRFYEPSLFDFFDLSIEKLSSALLACRAHQPRYLGLHVGPLPKETVSLKRRIMTSSPLNTLRSAKAALKARLRPNT